MFRDFRNWYWNSNPGRLKFWETYIWRVNDILSSGILKSWQNPGNDVPGKCSGTSGTGTGTQILEDLNFEKHIFDVWMIYWVPEFWNPDKIPGMIFQGNVLGLPELVPELKTRNT
jgi:hypothetical protein